MNWKKGKVDQAIDALVKTNSTLISGIATQHNFTIGMNRELIAALERIKRLEERLNRLEGS